MACNCQSKYCPECSFFQNGTGFVSVDAILDPKDREAIDKEYQEKLKILALKAAFLEFSYSCRCIVMDSNGNREFHRDFDPFDWTAKEKIVGDAEKFKVFKKMLENF